MKNININYQKTKSSLICGILGYLCYLFGDWIMIYGDPNTSSKLNLKILTKGTASIPQWRYSLSMFMAFPGIILSLLKYIWINTLDCSSPFFYYDSKPFFMDE